MYFVNCSSLASFSRLYFYLWFIFMKIKTRSSYFVGEIIPLYLLLLFYLFCLIVQYIELCYKVKCSIAISLLYQQWRIHVWRRAIWSKYITVKVSMILSGICNNRNIVSMQSQLRQVILQNLYATQNLALHISNQENKQCALCFQNVLVCGVRYSICKSTDRVVLSIWTSSQYTHTTYLVAYEYHI